MTQEEKKLLIKDLCARLPYGVKFAYNNVYTAKGLDLIITDEGTWEYAVLATCIEPIEISFIKPYLRPMSSMSEKESVELEHLSDEYFGKALDKQIQESLSSSDRTESRILEYIASSVIIDWLNAHYFDYRGLIEKGLALKAPEEMYKIE